MQMTPCMLEVKNSRKLPRKQKRNSGAKKGIRQLAAFWFRNINKEGMLLVHRKSCTRGLKLLHKNGQFTHFRSLLAILSWSTNSRLDSLWKMVLKTQGPEENFQKKPPEYIKKTSNDFEQIHENPEVYLQFRQLNLESTKVSVYSSPHTQARTTVSLSWDILYFYRLILTTASFHIGIGINWND